MGKSKLIVDIREMGRIVSAMEEAGYSSYDVDVLIEINILAGALKVVRGTAKFVDIPVEKILKFLSGVPVPAVTELFIVGDNFSVKNTLVNIASVSDLSIFPMAVAPREGYRMACYRILKFSSDRMITMELLESGQYPTTDLAAVFSLIKSQPNGFDGLQRTNLFHIRDLRGKIRVVWVFGGWDGWYIDVFPFLDGSRWDVGSLVFARKF